ncbi:DUF2249 domain-containing protein [Lysobacter sp. A3-1-A15]|uniref:DUF2249 domain-containing protein n=1 Tax=Novilysobacter viscosus TaxID=3098602 RepID=UPI002ED91B13
MSPPAFQSLDLRALPAPEPMVRALDAADALAPGGVLELLTPRLPAPLIQQLRDRGLHVSAERLDEGSARVTVQWPDGDAVDGKGDGEDTR